MRVYAHIYAPLYTRMRRIQTLNVDIAVLGEAALDHVCCYVIIAHVDVSSARHPVFPLGGAVVHVFITDLLGLCVRVRVCVYVCVYVRVCVCVCMFVCVCYYSVATMEFIYIYIYNYIIS